MPASDPGSLLNSVVLYFNIGITECHAQCICILLARPNAMAPLFQYIYATGRFRRAFGDMTNERGRTLKGHSKRICGDREQRMNRKVMYMMATALHRAKHQKTQMKKKASAGDKIRIMTPKHPKGHFDRGVDAHRTH